MGTTSFTARFSSGSLRRPHFFCGRLCPRLPGASRSVGCVRRSLSILAVPHRAAGLGRPLAGAARSGWPLGTRSVRPKWISTTYTLLELRRLGLAQDHAPASVSTRLLQSQKVWLRGKRSAYWEACVACFALGLASWFDGDARLRDALVEDVLVAQMPDGGWNCRRPRGATYSSFHTTINVLEGLHDYTVARAACRRQLKAAQARAHDSSARTTCTARTVRATSWTAR